MKKTIIFIICIIIVVITLFWTKYINFKAEKAKIKEANLEYEVYLNKQIKGRELTTAVNRAVNNNETNNIKKDDNGFYESNDINSVKIEIAIIDNNTTYQMETLYNGGMTTFLQYYSDISFECKKIDYNSQGKVSYLLFEQITG